MRAFARFIAKFLAVIFSILFVLSALIALVLNNIERRLFDVDFYKRALQGQAIYERLPAIVAEQIAVSISYNPCEENPIACGAEGASPELTTCLVDALGNEAFEAVARNTRPPTDAELRRAQPCLDQFGETIWSSGTNPFQDSTYELRSCARQAIGEEPFDEIYNDLREPTQVEKDKLQPCFDNFGSTQDELSNGPPEFMRNLTPGDWESILKSILPPDVLRGLTEEILDQIFYYLNGEASQASISLKNIKERLTGQAGVDAVMQLLDAQRVCTQLEVNQLLYGGSEYEINYCKHPVEALEELEKRIQSQLVTVVENIPDEAVIINPQTSGASGGPLGNDPVKIIGILRVVLRLSPLLPYGFLLLITLLTIRSLKDWLRWWGIPFLITGVVGIIMGIAIMPLLTWAWQSFVNIPSMLSPTFTQLLFGLIRGIGQGLSQPIIIRAFLLGILGLGSIIGAALIKNEPLITKKEKTTRAEKTSS